MDLTELINHPQKMDRETLYELRSLVALYPYFQTARLLMLQNLYLLHDASFDEELRRAALYVTDRKVIFDMVEAAHYRLQQEQRQQPRSITSANVVALNPGKTPAEADRTTSLIDSFLQQMPEEEEKKEGKEERRKPTPADAAVDYVAYLLQMEEEESHEQSAPKMKGQSLIDDFIHRDNGTFTLQETPEFLPETDTQKDNRPLEEDDTYLTETLAQIYIKQGRYEKALDIIKRLNVNTDNRSAHLEDQIRFLQKLILIKKLQ